jgi:hypothetical protein
MFSVVVKEKGKHGKTVGFYKADDLDLVVTKESAAELDFYEAVNTANHVQKTWALRDNEMVQICSSGRVSDLVKFVKSIDNGSYTAKELGRKYFLPMLW